VKIRFRHGATARQIATVHEKLGMAAKVLLQTMDVHNERHQSVLNAPTQDALYGLAQRIRLSMYGLEEPFVKVAGMDTPFANTDNPAAWNEWLDQRDTAVVEPSA
jgi:hypothetical protein